jgi:hypothetical protein
MLALGNNMLHNGDPQQPSAIRANVPEQGRLLTS